jgi:hypothetical protein
MPFSRKERKNRERKRKGHLKPPETSTKVLVGGLAALAASGFGALHNNAQMDAHGSRVTGEMIFATAPAYAETGEFLVLDPSPQTGPIQIDSRPSFLAPQTYGTEAPDIGRPGEGQVISTDLVFDFTDVAVSALWNFGYDSDGELMYIEEVDEDGQESLRLNNRVRECAIPLEPIGPEADVSDWRGKLAWVACSSVANITSPEYVSSSGPLSFDDTTGAWRVGGEAWGSNGSTLVDPVYLYGGIVTGTPISPDAVPSRETIEKIRGGDKSDDASTELSELPEVERGDGLEVDTAPGDAPDPVPDSEQRDSQFEFEFRGPEGGEIPEPREDTGIGWPDWEWLQNLQKLFNTDTPPVEVDEGVDIDADIEVDSSTEGAPIEVDEVDTTGLWEKITGFFSNLNEKEREILGENSAAVSDDLDDEEFMQVEGQAPLEESEEQLEESAEDTESSQDPEVAADNEPHVYRGTIPRAPRGYTSLERGVDNVFINLPYNLFFNWIPQAWRYLIDEGSSMVERVDVQE